ncbi:Hypothetical protein SRAE_1000220100 [Strongyloides ratti]|uniref:Uncharacterized protein n=1 Tax=Strongyloides ratti TaxID=34506 RepID=A0A090L8V5_STRRB|nr:Hypothetical protein SRAE_1000220100 [Strongyloides ratti]CEF63945.1 Hypothetical protein SRAE_1000220100 [Strongyloides ratti]
MTFSTSRERTHNHHDGRINRIHGNEYNHFRGSAQKCYEYSIDGKNYKTNSYLGTSKYSTFHYNDSKYKYKSKWYSKSEPNINLLSKTEVEKNHDKETCKNNISCSKDLKKVLDKKTFKIISKPQHVPECHYPRYLDQKKIK